MTNRKRYPVAVALSSFMLMFTAKPAHAHPKPLPRKFLHGALCIHRHEASWRDSGAPYYGGLQFDYGFMRTYGRRLLRRKGTADHWTPHEQLHVAYRGYLARGWYPWPAAARMCGLL